MKDDFQASLFDETADDFNLTSPAVEIPAAAGATLNHWDKDLMKRTLDELFTLTSQYKSSKSYYKMLEFVAKFREYSPYNGILVHIQMPGAVFVAPPHRWLRDYGRTIIPGSRPLVILRPMGPVMFVFDVSATEGEPLPPEIEKPFEVRSGKVNEQFNRTIANAGRDGVRFDMVNYGSQQAACIYCIENICDTIRYDNTDVYIRYAVELDQNASKESQYASLTHELAHLYCGHQGTPYPGWWPDRRGIKHNVREFEAESVAYLVCKRLGLKTTSEQYLSWYLEKSENVPEISLECVMKAAVLIESMAYKHLKARKIGKD